MKELKDICVYCKRKIDMAEVRKLDSISNESYHMYCWNEKLLKQAELENVILRSVIQDDKNELYESIKSLLLEYLK